MSRYRFALRPKWIVSHLFVAALVVAMMAACSWQLSRLQEKKDRNAKVAARTGEPVVGVGTIVEPGSYDRAEGVEFRRVTATGTYQADQEVLVRSRSRDGAPGSWVLTPLELSDGAAVIVNRGWIPNSGQLQSVPERYAASSGEVTVTGLVRRTETRGRFGPRDPESGVLDNLARADIARLDRQVPQDLLPVYVQLERQRPATRGAAPSAVPIPALDEGPHLSYAVQWAIFTTVALVGYPLILRRRARDIEKEAVDEDLDGPDPLDEPGPGDPRLDGLPGATRSADPNA
ncbi:MAG: SURF1 family protein [Acidimicrobiia bacterium]|nr:SURF1 family protein [Acidimicrobiia bacterium]